MKAPLPETGAALPTSFGEVMNRGAGLDAKAVTIPGPTGLETVLQYPDGRVVNLMNNLLVRENNEIGQANVVSGDIRGDLAAPDIRNATEEATITDRVATSERRKFRQLLTATAEQIKAFVQNAYLNKNKHQYIKICDVDQRLAAALRSVGIEADGSVHLLNDHEIRHTDKNHGSKSNAKYKVGQGDFVRARDIIEPAEPVLLRLKVYCFVGNAKFQQQNFPVYAMSF